MNNKVFVGNLPFDVSEDALRDFFEADGHRVESVRIITDRFTGRSRGFGFVELEEGDDVQRAITSLNGKELMGRSLVINEANERPRKPRFQNNRDDQNRRPRY
ncbi:RNA-binding protein [bacterium]|nr:RNA-binding protein [candidate division CSSED10-310 bacterium]